MEYRGTVVPDPIAWANCFAYMLSFHEIEQARSSKGGFSKAGLESLGVPWPPPKGWKKSLLNGLPIEPVQTKAEQQKEFIDKALRRAARIKALRSVRRAKRKNGIANVVSREPRDKWTKETRDKLLEKVNLAEWHVASLLNGCRVHFERERPFAISGRKYFVDFMVTSIVTDKRRKVRVAVEVDGGYHFTEEQQAKDRVKDAALLSTSRVWSILRISAEVAMKMTREELRSAILSNRLGSVTCLYS